MHTHYNTSSHIHDYTIEHLLTLHIYTHTLDIHTHTRTPSAILGCIYEESEDVVLPSSQSFSIVSSSDEFNTHTRTH